MPAFCSRCRKEVTSLFTSDPPTHCPDCGQAVEQVAGGPRTPGRLLLKDGENTLGEFQIQETIRVGKDRTCFVQSLHPSMSLKHAEIRPENDRYYIKDLGSNTGTRVNGKTIQETELQDGDEIMVGEVRFLFINPPERAIPGQQFSISYAETGTDLDVKAALSPTELATRDVADLKKDKTQIISLELQRLQRIYEIGREIASSTELADIMQRVMDAYFANIGPSRAVILLKHPSTGELYTAMASTKKNRSPTSRMSLSRTIVNAAMKRKEAVLIQDTGQLNVNEEHTIRRLGIRSALCTPLICKGTTLGCIYLDSLDLNRTFDESDLRTMVGISGMAAVAIMNARLIDRLNTETELRMKLQKQLGADGGPSGAIAASLGPADVKMSTIVCLRLFGADEMLKEGAKPDRVAAILSDLLGVLHDRISANQGDVLEVTGTQVLAGWGVRRPSKRGPLRALKAVFELRQGFQGLNEARIKKGLEPIDIAYGISVGNILGGALSFRGQVGQAVFGPAAESAVRLGYAADKTQVFISESMKQLVGEFMEATPVSFPDGTRGYRVEALMGKQDDLDKTRF